MSEDAILKVNAPTVCQMNRAGIYLYFSIFSWAIYIPGFPGFPGLFIVNQLFPNFTSTLWPIGLLQYIFGSDVYIFQFGCAMNLVY